MTALDLITLGIASAGLLLAMINTYWAIRRDRVRLKVEPIWLMDHGNHIDRAGNPTGVLVATSTRPDAPERLSGGHIGIRVINQGDTPVTITQVGFYTARWYEAKKDFRGKWTPVLSDFLEAVELPRRLEPKDSLQIATAASTGSSKTLARTRKVYVRTACQTECYATSALLRRLARDARATSSK